MSSKVLSAAVLGLDCQLIEVEADTTRALPAMAIVGLPDKAIDEAKERVRSAIKNSGLEMPRSRVTVNLAPADLKKEGPAYDLPIALSILLASGQVDFKKDWSKQLFIGELALDGQLRPVNGVLSITLFAKEKGIETLYLPAENAVEASLISGLEIIPVRNLFELTAHLLNQQSINPFQGQEIDLSLIEESDLEADMAYIAGQEHVKRALEIASAGGHNVLMMGPPGAGKTLLAKAMTTILPEMTLGEALEVTRIYSAAGKLKRDKPLMTCRPFRHPHHTASNVALVGGSTMPKPGEISLAHRGLLFLDELPEFHRDVLEALRQPLEDGRIAVSRIAGTLEFPAKFILVAAMNPCPCGYANDPNHPCICSISQVIRYRKKISGPLLDRIDLHLEVPKVKFEKLTKEFIAEKSKDIRKRVSAARYFQLQRFKDLNIITNAEMSPRQIKEFCPLDLKSLELLKNAVSQLYLSARAYHRILKVARTIADLASETDIKIQHLAEALQYRPKVE